MITQEKEIYKLLNDIQIDLDTYDEEDLSELEIRRTKKCLKERLFRRTKENKVLRRRIIAMAALIICIGIWRSEPVKAAIRLMSYNISQGLGIEKDLATYTQVINRSITKKGVTIQLNEVILDGDEIIISYTVKTPGKVGNTRFKVDSKVYIEEQEAFMRRARFIKVDEYTINHTTSYRMEETIEYEGDVKIQLVVNEVTDANEVYEDEWKFQFIANDNELKQGTAVMPLEQIYQLDQEQRVEFVEYKRNCLGDKIYYQREDYRLPGYYFQLRGVDDLGNEIIFVFAGERFGKGILELDDEIEGGISEEANFLKLRMYVLPEQEQRILKKEDYQPIGETFEVDLSLLNNEDVDRP